jgi:hypothetical protein
MCVKSISTLMFILFTIPCSGQLGEIFGKVTAGEEYIKVDIDFTHIYLIIRLCKYKKLD